MSHVRLLVALSLVALLLALVGTARAAGPITVTLSPLNNSGESGTAVLTDIGGGKVRVEVNVTGGPAGVPQPMHIHEGTCATLNPTPEYPLTTVVDGKSVTEITASFDELQNGNYAVNGHKSAAEASVYVFCGDIPKLAAAAPLPTTGADLFAPILQAAGVGLALLAAGLVVLRRATR